MSNKSETPRKLYSRFVRYGLLAVLAAVLTLGLVIQNTLGRRGHSRLDLAETQIQILTRALDYFEQDMGRYPTREEGLATLVRNPGLDGWDGPYLEDRSLQKDPWGIDFEYQALPSDGFKIVSAGPDRVFGNRDDIRLQNETQRRHLRTKAPIGLLVAAGEYL
jgi:general secretion pathway protein G